MAASDNLHPVQFRRDDADRDYAGDAGDYSGPDGDFGYADLREDQYERIGRETVDVDPKAERKALRLS
jgi:hypothetical protein